MQRSEPINDTWVFFVTLALAFFGLWQLIPWLPAFLLALVASAVTSFLAEIAAYLKVIAERG